MICRFWQGRLWAFGRIISCPFGTTGRLGGAFVGEGGGECGSVPSCGIFDGMFLGKGQVVEGGVVRRRFLHSYRDAPVYY